MTSGGHNIGFRSQVLPDGNVDVKRFPWFGSKKVWRKDAIYKYLVGWMKEHNILRSETQSFHVDNLATQFYIWQMVERQINILDEGNITKLKAAGKASNDAYKAIVNVMRQLDIKTVMDKPESAGIEDKADSLNAYNFDL